MPGCNQTTKRKGITMRKPIITENEIIGFFGEYRWLSNFYPSFVFDDYGLQYNYVENAYQASKTEDKKKRYKFTLLNPYEAKKLGRKLELRNDWNNIKLIVMEDLIYKKFNLNNELRNKLLSTGNKILIEYNDWNDVYWGICNGYGKNHLGRIIMKVRDNIVAYRKFIDRVFE